MSVTGVEHITDRLTATTLTNTTTTTTTVKTTTNKPDFRELDLGSPISPLRPFTGPGFPAQSSSSSSSSGSAQKAHSGELSPSHRPRHSRSHSYGSNPVNSPPLNFLPTGNICPSGRFQKTGTPAPARVGPRPDVLGSGTGNYGHGNIIRAGVGPAPVVKMDPEEVKRAGNEQYRRGNFAEALSLYDRAIAASPANAAIRSNRAAALMALGRVSEAVRECEEAVRLDPGYGRAHHRLGVLLIRFGQVEVARKHLCYAGQQPESTELHKLQAVEKHLSRCSDARRIGDWKGTLSEGDAAIVAGADYSPQLFSCRVECLLKLQQLDDIDSIMSNIPKVNPSPLCCSQSKFFGMLSEAYLFYVRAQIDLAMGRFEIAVTSAEKAGKIDPRNTEVAGLLNNVRMVARARARGNDLFKSERFTEACAAYGEGLKLDPSNPVLYCNRAACWFKLGMWERSIDDCNRALRIQPSYTKALLRRAASNSKLERWVQAVRDYDMLRRELPLDNEVAESLFHAEVALKKSRGEEVYNMKFGGDVEEISGLEQFRAEISSSGVSVVHFKIASNPQCRRISSFLDMLCGQYPSIIFLKVDVEESPDVANAENVRIVPTFKIYKNGSKVKEIVNPTSDVLEASVKHYSC